MKVQTVSEMLRMTVAFAAVASLLRAMVEWRQLHAAGVSPDCGLGVSGPFQGTQCLAA